MTTGHVTPASLLNPTNFPPRIDRSTSIPPGTKLILAADLSHRDLTSAEKHGLHWGTHILITQDRVNQRFSTWDEIDHARAVVARALADERRKATRAAELAERAVAGEAPPLKRETSSKTQWRANRSPEQIATDRQRDAERKRAARSAAKAAPVSQGHSS